MPKIIQLSENLSNMIAAGEVIERPFSVVKELVENSLDAGSTKVEINLIDSGMRLIEVIDNGHGMDKEDALLSFSRHATSKIKNEHDLFRIHTLGFRGEAIPSIASVSEMTLKTCEDDIGYMIVNKGGTIISNTETSARKGTHITVKNLFYNTPARLKYIKSLEKEIALIADMIDKLAISNPDVAFTLRNNNKKLFHTNGLNDITSIIGQIYGLEVAKNTIYIESNHADFKVRGYIVKPEFARSRNNHITCVVNDRVIKNKGLLRAVIDGYDTYLPVRRYPIVLLYIDVDPLLIDVNVHPAKLEVRLSNENIIRQELTKLIKENLEKKQLIPKIILKKEVETNEIQESFTFKEYNIEPKQLVKKEIVKETIIEEVKEVVEEEIKLPSTKQLPYLEYIGQFAGTYLICQNDKGLYLIDQHAAEERIRYEYFKDKLASPGIDTQPLLTPYNIEFTNKEAIFIEANNQLFEEIGIKLEPSGLKSFYIRELPIWLINEEISIIEDLVYQIIEYKRIDIGKIRDDLAKSISCKSSIKANHKINNDEIRVLLDRLGKCINPYTCPHGRPVVINFSHSEIETMFKRIM